MPRNEQVGASPPEYGEVGGSWKPGVLLDASGRSEPRDESGVHPQPLQEPVRVLPEFTRGVGSVGQACGREQSVEEEAVSVEGLEGSARALNGPRASLAHVGLTRARFGGGPTPRRGWGCSRARANPACWRHLNGIFGRETTLADLARVGERCGVAAVELDAVWESYTKDGVKKGPFRKCFVVGGCG